MECAKWLFVLTDIKAPLLVPSPLEEQGGFKAFSGFYTVSCVCQLKKHCFSKTRNALTTAMNPRPDSNEISPVLRAACSNYCLQGGDKINAESYMSQ